MLVTPTLTLPANAGSTLHEVEIKDFEFSPAQLDVKVGDQVQFTNRDIAPHTATAVDASWDTGELSFGKHAVITVTESWETEFFCIFHPVMTGAVNIVS